MATATVCRTVRLNDIGVVFTVTIVECDAEGELVVKDISLASVKELIFQKPDDAQTAVVQTAVFTTDGTDGKIQYTAAVDDLDEVGRWFLEGRVTLPTGVFTSSRGHFDVEEIIA